MHPSNENKSIRSTNELKWVFIIKALVIIGLNLSQRFAGFGYEF